MTADFPDHFSGHAGDYARFRPSYPPALFRWLAGLCPRRELAWDAGCGNGQAAAGLADHFDHVVASDASLDQLRAAESMAGVWRVNDRAEACSLRSHTVDLAVSAQAAHWFRQESFHNELRRVVVDGGVVAIWCYGLNRIGPGVDPIVRRFHDVTLAADWPRERRHIETGYRELAFPFAEFETPDFELTVEWSLPAFAAYLATWSAYRRHRHRTGTDPLPDLVRELVPDWGGGARVVRWPIHLRAGKVQRT